MIFENHQPLNNSLMLKLLKKSIIYVDAEIEYLNLNSSMDGDSGFVSSRICAYFKKLPFFNHSELNCIKYTIFLTMHGILVES